MDGNGGPGGRRRCRSRILLAFARTRTQNRSIAPDRNVTLTAGEQMHDQSCAPAPLSCLHFGLNMYSQNQVPNDSQMARNYQL